MTTVNLSNSTKFESEPGQTLLDAARVQGVALEHSCRTGRCGVCKARVVSGKTRLLQPELSLTEFELLEDYILTCCRSAESDVELDIEDLGALGAIEVQTVPCRIDTRQMLSSDVIEIVLRTPPAGKLAYFAGQYIEIIGKDGLRRSYSVANAPRQDGKIILHVRKVESGRMSDYWYKEARDNDLLRMEGPLGTFSLRITKQLQLVLLATGTGIAPVKAILEQLEANPEQNTYENIHVYWGGRIEQDIYWKPDLPSLSFNFTPVLSRSTQDWQGKIGFVQQALLDDEIKLDDAVVYACGSEAMINSALESLTMHGLNEKYFYSDAFLSAN
jgi:CDP-4-dehydro-6-deoxyglucose reductase, E3